MSPSLPAKLSRERRFAALAVLTLGGFTLIAVGLMRLQIVQHEDFLRLAQENRVRLEVLRGPRGAIVDRHGDVLADNAPSFNIVFRPAPAESAQRSRAAINSAWL